MGRRRRDPRRLRRLHRHHPPRPERTELRRTAMPYYRRVGEVPPKRHTLFPKPEGGWYAEEMMGIEGFSHASALLYHRHSPSAIVAIETAEDWRGPLQPNMPLQPYHLRTPE